MVFGGDVGSILESQAAAQAGLRASRCPWLALCSLFTQQAFIKHLLGAGLYAGTRGRSREQSNPFPALLGV